MDTIRRLSHELMHSVIRILAVWVVAAACPVVHARCLPSEVGVDSLRPAERDSLLSPAHVVYVPDRLPAARQSLSGSALLHLSGRSVAEAMSTMAGLQVRDYGGVGGLKTIDVRGMGTSHTGVFCDGMPLSNEQNGQVDLGRFATGAFERVELYHGGASNMMQSARQWAAGNSVEMVSRRPEFADSARFGRVAAALRAGSFGRVEPSVRWERRFRRGFALTTDAAYLHAHGRYTFRLRKTFPDGSVAYDTTAVREGGDISAFRAEMNLFSPVESAAKWQAKAYVYTSERGIPAAIVNNVWGSSQRQGDTDIWIQGRWQRTFGNRYTLRLAGKGVMERLHYRNPDTLQLRVDRTFTQPALYLSAVHRVALGRGTYGAHYEFAVATDYAFNTLHQSSRWNLPYGSLQHPKRHTLMSAVVGSMSWRNWRTVATFHHTFTADATDLQPEVRRQHFLSPVVMSTLRPLPSLSLRAMVRRHQRRPTFNELYYHEIGNVSLLPEQCWQYCVGGDFERTFCQRAWTFSLSADAFLHWITDKIVAVPRGSGQWRWMMLNVGKVFSRGIDLKGKVVWRVTGAMTFDVSAHYSFIRAEDRSDSTDNDPQFGTFRGQIPYLPRHAGGLTVLWSWGDVSLSYVWSGVGERYRSSANTPGNRLRPWNTHDVSLLLAVPRVPWLRFSAACYNISGRQYEVVPNYPMPQRHFLLGIRFLTQRYR